MKYHTKLRIQRILCRHMPCLLAAVILAYLYLSKGICGTERAVIRRGFIGAPGMPFHLFFVYFRGVAGLAEGEWYGRPGQRSRRGGKMNILKETK
jgi:hypothetical protein